MNDHTGTRRALGTGVRRINGDIGGIESDPFDDGALASFGEETHQRRIPAVLILASGQA
jgi:hypothetical protein